MKRIVLAVALIGSQAWAQPKKPVPRPSPDAGEKKGGTPFVEDTKQPDDPYAEPPPKKADPPAKKAPAEPPLPPGVPPRKQPTDPLPPAKKAPADAAPVPAKKQPTDPLPPAKKAPDAPPAPPVPAKKGDPNAAKAPEDPYGAAVPPRIGLTDVAAVQGLLAVQRLDGWLLFDRDGENPIAKQLVAPDGHPTHAWFYLVAAQGSPTALFHISEAKSFEKLPGKKIAYEGYRDFDKALKEALKGVRTVALEYSPKASVPAVSRIDAGTLEVIRAVGVQVKSSDTLVQYTKAMWGDAGRTAHHVAAHHLVELRKEALNWLAMKIAQGTPVTEYDVQQRLAHGMTMRGLVGPPPMVAAAANTADPYYAPTAAKTRPISRGDLIVVTVAGKLDKPDGIFAEHTWLAVADTVVAAPIASAFALARQARDAALAQITARSVKHRPITGAEVDDATRALIKKAGMGDKIMHRTGHSLDNDLQGSGADLDDFETKDTRILLPGTGFTVGPGLYFAGSFGVRAEVSAYLAPGGPEITTPAQDEIETLLK